MTPIAPVLERLGIPQYIEAFVAEGFNTWETVLDVTEEDLVSLNVKRGHRRKIQREIATARGWPRDRPLAGPSPTGIYTPQEKVGEADLLSSSPGNSGHHDISVVGTGKRKYRRRPKPDGLAPEKPPSAYVIFSNIELKGTRESLKGQNLSFAEIAKLVGQNWQALSTEQREAYELEASTAKQIYNEELSEYKKTDSYREYKQYLADFKAKQDSKQSAEAKRRRAGSYSAPAPPERIARSGAGRRASEAGATGLGGTAMMDILSTNSAFSGQTSPSDPPLSSMPWLLHHSGPGSMHSHLASQDHPRWRYSVSPTSSSGDSAIEQGSVEMVDPLLTPTEPRGDRQTQLGPGRSPHPSSRLMPDGGTWTSGRPAPTLLNTAAPGFTHDQNRPLKGRTQRPSESPSQAGLLQTTGSTLSPGRGDGSFGAAPVLTSVGPSDVPRLDTTFGEGSRPSFGGYSGADLVSSSFRRPPPPLLPPLRLSSTNRYESAPASHAIMTSRGVASLDEQYPHRSLDTVKVHDVPPRPHPLPAGRSLGHPEPSASQPPTLERSSTDETTAEAPAQYPHPSSPFAVLLKASESISDRDLDQVPEEE